MSSVLSGSRARAESCGVVILLYSRAAQHWLCVFENVIVESNIHCVCN